MTTEALTRAACSAQRRQRRNRHASIFIWVFIALLLGPGAVLAQENGFSMHGEPLGADGLPLPYDPPDICFVDAIRSQIGFEPDSSELAPCACRILDKGIEVLKEYPDLRVEIAGHADLVEGRNGGQALSLRRARAAYDYLRAAGVPAVSLIGPVGYGAERNLSPEDAEATVGRRENRRVELNVHN